MTRRLRVSPRIICRLRRWSIWRRWLDSRSVGQRSAARRPIGAFVVGLCRQMLIEEALPLVKREQLDAVVEIDMACALDPDEFLRFGGTLVGIFAIPWSSPGRR